MNKGRPVNEPTRKAAQYVAKRLSKAAAARLLGCTTQTLTRAMAGHSIHELRALWLESAVQRLVTELTQAMAAVEGT